jgi:glyoxylase-like metal-dependent hydrolase (beta-lactamase superfamily II)
MLTFSCLREKGKCRFTGDTLFNGDYGRTDLPDGNEQDIFASLRRLFAMDGNIRVYPGHGGTTTIAREASQALVRSDGFKTIPLTN